VIVRAALPSDVPALAAVAGASYRAGFGGFLDPAALAARDQAHFIGHFGDHWPSVTVAANGRVILGFAQVTARITGAPHLDMLFVDPAAFSTGIGSRLLAEAEKRGAITLECFAKNTRARSFYEHAGWRRTHAYRRDFAGVTEDFVWYARDGGKPPPWTVHQE
jgi:putative acetyltransferase